MPSVLSDYLQSLGVSREESSRLTRLAQPITIGSSEIIQPQGTTPCHFFFLEQGTCQACYLTAEGKQFSKEFYWEPEFIIGFESLLDDRPSPISWKLSARLGYRLCRGAACSSGATNLAQPM
ncbi:Crp/Fnr family transcriptional regulator [Dongshaea marina]|uniref:Crp/Fnr family transcriptional regulator n=1 Tax=Dongshaea marina TaxID=2047966 RepID=UPI0018FF5815|nr:Crp/Fnr family transcriptional regulator [Dongshaea marina]